MELCGVSFSATITFIFLILIFRVGDENGKKKL